MKVKLRFEHNLLDFLSWSPPIPHYIRKLKVGQKQPLKLDTEFEIKMRQLNNTPSASKRDGTLPILIEYS
jgi:hypothetical protein